jgi:thioredoxin 1
MDEVLRVVCFCARWCGVCRDYVALFEQAAVQFGADAEFRQVDIEDEAELLGNVDVEDFPTLLIARADRALFFGTVTPHAQTLARLVRAALADELPPPPADPAIDALARRVSAWCRRGAAPE